MLFLLIISYIGVILFELPGMIKEKMWGEIIVFCLITLLTLVFTVPHVMNWPTPNPGVPIEMIYRPITVFIMEELLR